jgi:hypothetical protein
VPSAYEAADRPATQRIPHQQRDQCHGDPEGGGWLAGGGHGPKSDLVQNGGQGTRPKLEETTD